MNIPKIDAARVMGRVARLWDGENCAHHVVNGATGTGKSTLITRGILPLAERERQLIFDVKGDDPVWGSYPALPVERITPGFGSAGEGGGPDGRWFRLVLDMTDLAAAKRIAREALEIVQDEGNCVAVLDETRRMTDTEELNLGQPIETMLMGGRSRHLSVITTLTATEWTKPSIRNQWSFAYTGALRDDEVRKRWLKILGLPYSEKAGYLDALRTIPRRTWLYRDTEDNGALAYFEIEP